MQAMKKWEVDIVGFVETNIAWTPKNEAKLKHIGRNVFGARHFAVSSSDEASINEYQPGGAMIGVVGHHAGRVLTSGNDEHGYGRWSYLCLTGQGLKVYVVVAYRVAQESNDGIHTAYIQQYRLMRQKGVEKPHPRRQWCKDLLPEIKKWKQEGEVLLLTDANSALGDKEFAPFLAEAGLYDILGYLHGVGGTNSHIKGQQRITFALGTSNIVKAAREGGMLPFHEILTSDHRAIHLEFDSLQLFRGEIHAIHSQPGRKVTSKHPKLSEKYRRIVTAKVRMNQLEEQIDQHLAAVLSNTATEPVQQMHRLDDMMHNIMVDSENELPAIPPYWWSEPVHKAHLIVEYWRKALSFWQNGINGEMQLKTLEIEIGVEHDVTYGMAGKTERGYLRRAQKELRKLRNNSRAIRDDWQEKQAEEAEKKDPKSTKATIIRTIRNKEEAAQMWALIGRYLNNENRDSLNHLLVPDYKKFRTKTQQAVAHYVEQNEEAKAQACSVIYQMMHNYKLGLEKYMPHKRVVLKNDMDAELLRFHKRHFRQAEETPFASTQLQELLGYCGDSPFAEQLRDGTADIQSLDIDGYTKEFLEEMKHTKSDPPQVQDELKLTDVMAGFKLWNELTGTSPLGNHLGLYKTWFKTTKHNEDAQEDELQTHQFFGMVTKLLRMALHLMAPKRRWKTVHNLFILKEPGNYKISRMRTIHKIDAELNLIRRTYLAHRTMANAERYGHLDDAQFGGRQGKTATDPVLIKVLALETSHLQRSNMGLTDCDAKACYDRIVPSVSSLLETKAGAPKKVSILFARILELMEYYPVTGKGVADIFNKHDDESSIFGSGQGAADAPFKWTITDNAIIKLFRRWAIGRLIQDTLRQIKEKRDNVMFVDDQTLLHNIMAMFAVSCYILMGIIQYDVTLWGRFLWVSGGWLEYSKTQYCVLIWNFRPDGTPYLLKEEELPENTVTIQGADGSNTLLKRFGVTKAVKMLGVRHAANLQQDTECNNLLGKTLKFSCAIMACPLRQHQVLRCYFGIYMASISYALPTTSMTEAHCDKIQKALTTKILPRLGYHHGFPQNIVFGPKSLGGIGLYSVEGEQLVAKLCAVVMNLRANTAVGREFLVALSWAQAQAGVGTQLLEDTRPIPHLGGRYIRHLRECMHKINAKVIISGVYPLILERVHDAYIMDEFLDSPHVVAGDQERLNGCRLFLQANTIAHIATSDGRKIKPEYFWPQLIPTTVHNKALEGIWPRQGRPDKATWKLWRDSLIKTICNEEGVLHTRLGLWTNKSARWHMYSNGKFLYMRIDKKWSKHRCVKNTRHGCKYNKRPVAVVNQPKGTPVTDLRVESEFFASTTVQTWKRQPPTPPHPQTWQSYVKTLKRWERHLLAHLEECCHGYLPLQTLLQLDENIWLVTDGGLDDGIGYFGWVIASDRQIMWENRGHAAGDPLLIETLRTEGIGLLSVMVFLKHFLLFHNVRFNPAKTIHYCDNMGVVRRIRWGEIRSILTPGECLKPDADVILQIEDIYREWGCALETRHVKGHQDRSARVRQALRKSDKADKTGERAKRLSWEATLNIRADKLATKAKQELTDNPPRHEHFLYPGCKAHLIIDNRLITRRVKREIREAWNKRKLRKEYKTRFKWKSTTFDTVDWVTFGRVIRKQNFYLHKFVVKIINKRLPVRGEKYSTMPDKTCPGCGAETETNRHFLLCNKNPEVWTGLQKELTLIFKKYTVDPVIRILILMVVLQQKLTWVKRKHVSINWKNYENLIKQQSEIGWEQILFGRYGKKWQHTQVQYVHHSEDVGVTYDEMWLDVVIQTTWRFMQLRWKARNAWLHESTGGYNATKEVLIARIQMLYKRESELLVQDRKIFRMPIDQWKHRSVTDMKRWITANQPFITACIKLRMQQDKKKSQDIRIFYKQRITKRGEYCKRRKGTSRTKPTPRKEDKQHVLSHTQKDIRRTLLGWDNEMCRDHDAEERRIQRGLTTYFTTQDRPPDDNFISRQPCLTEYFGTSPKV